MRHSPSSTRVPFCATYVKHVKSTAGFSKDAMMNIHHLTTPSGLSWFTQTRFHQETFFDTQITVSFRWGYMPNKCSSDLFHENQRVVFGDSSSFPLSFAFKILLYGQMPKEGSSNLFFNLKRRVKTERTCV